MRLKKIKLAGFKSFVDPTTVPITANMVGIVGPNGCGKSNIIDAVRWVMGESSARHLRGDSLADVIFSGSSARKPVGQASVELIFDNSDGRAGGEYARYSEIVVRREASRDGTSDYSLNRTHCRRKDITDLFLGTGLGPRAYSIIEQGMITRIVEARPEDLRLFLEEAAGISRYKERRRDTETRLRHVRDNLERLNDVRSEVDQQLGRLKRQAAAAENYKLWRERERELRVALAARQYQQLVTELEQSTEAGRVTQTALEAEIANQRSLETRLERLRLSRNAAADQVAVTHERHYALGAEVARLEQEIAHARALLAERRSEHQTVVQACERLAAEIVMDEQSGARLAHELEALTPTRATAAAAEQTAITQARMAEAAVDAWRREFEQAGMAAQAPARAHAAARSELTRLHGRLDDLKTRSARLQAEIQAIVPPPGEGLAALRAAVTVADHDYEQARARLTEIEERLARARQRLEAVQAELFDHQAQMQAAEARLASLGGMQAQALRTGQEVVSRWLQEQGLAQAPRLATQISADPGWEQAAERWLGARLAAVCVPPGTLTADRIRALAKTPVILFETRAGNGNGLAGHVRAPFDIEALFAGAIPVGSLEEALTQRAGLAPTAVLVTPEGVCIGRDLVAFAGEHDERAGVLAREREIQDGARHRQQLQAALAAADAVVEEARAELLVLEAQRTEAQRGVEHNVDVRTRAHSAAERAEAEERNRHARHEHLRRDGAELERERAAATAELDRAERHEREVAREAERGEQTLAALAEVRSVRQATLDTARAAAAQARDRRHQLDLAYQQAVTTHAAAVEHVTRGQTQLTDRQQRRQALALQIEQLAHAVEDPQQRLAPLLSERTTAETVVQAAQQVLDGVEQELSGAEHERQARDRAVRIAQEAVSRTTLAAHELRVRRDALVEGVRSQGLIDNLAELAMVMPADAAEGAEQELSALAERIARLGAVNLVAIEEYAEQLKRKTFLDAQDKDLTDAVALLDEAIRKIDHETRTRFRETFDRVNADFQTFFPRLFGGGEARLALSSEDLLETGVTVMARPPGKRNSTIHLLSGGEKALVAVALIFALFTLNPAPFCFLDEVDAPLDEANVGRFALILKELSQHTQMLFITHNKITMEAAEVLLGVTSAEPGVSRLVSVDVEEALEMVAQSAGA
ncbi:MAG: chromosome segregation protein SMC [Acidiferrobacter sp.]